MTPSAWQHRTWLAALAFALGGTAHAQTTLRMSDLFPTAYPFGELTAEFAEDVAERTQGQVKIEVFPAGSLTPPQQCFEGVLQGLSDICQAVLAYTPGRFPLMEVVDLPGYPASGMVTTMVANDIYQQFTPKELEQVKVLYVHAHPPGSIMTVDKPVRTLDDLRGMKIRSTGLSARILEALGASPVSMPITQAYDPLKRGVVEGTDGTFNSLRYYRFAEVTDYTTLSSDVGYVSTFAVVMNRSKWDALPEDVQAALETLADEYMIKAGELWDRIEQEGLDFGKEQGHTFIPLADDEAQRWRDAVLEPLHSSYVERANKAGLPGQEILDARQAAIEKHAEVYPPIEPPVGK